MTEYFTTHTDMKAVKVFNLILEIVLFTYIFIYS